MTRYTPNWLQQGSYSAAMDRRVLAALWPAAVSNGCAVTVSSGMALNVAPGQVAVPSQNSTGTSLCTSDAVETVTLAAAPGSGQNRYDLVVCQPRGNDLDGGANNDFIFVNVTGVAAATPTVPATPPGSVALAQIYIPGGSASVTAGNVTDVRPHGLGPEVPLAAGAALASYTDPGGEAWVAKGGVNGGAWRKARDVLHCAYYRAAGFSLQNAWSLLGLDTVVSDPYGLYNGATAYATIPVAGKYQFYLAVTGQAPANGWIQSAWNFPAGTSVGTNLANNGATAGTNTTAAGLIVRTQAAGDQLTTNMVASAASVTGTTASYLTRMSIDYLGSG